MRIADARLAPSRHPRGASGTSACPVHCGTGRVLVGSPASDGAVAVGTFTSYAVAGSSRGRSRRYQPSLSKPMQDKQPSFAERTETLQRTAAALKEAAETVLAEVQRMQAAQQRFAARRASRRA